VSTGSGSVEASTDAQAEQRSTTVARGTLVARVVKIKRLRAFLPDRAALHFGRAKALVRWWVQPDRRRRLIGQFELITLRTPFEGQARKVARRHALLLAVTGVFEERPWLVTDVPLVGYEPLEPIAASGRGAIVATVHSPASWMALLAGSLKRSEIAVVAGDWLWNFVTTAGPRRSAVFEASGATLVNARRSFRTLVTMLEEGKVVVLVADFPGRTEVTLLGKRALVDRGIARLSQLADVPVIPTLGTWDGARPSVRFGEAIYPVDGEDARVYMARVARGVDRLLSPRPEHWAAFTNEIWPDDAGPYLWAFEPKPEPTSRRGLRNLRARLRPRADT
jgi:lauroyl/myristoyl acyltransferase